MKNELLNKHKEIKESLKNDKLDNDQRFLLEARKSNIEKKLYRKFNIEIY